MSDLNNYTDSSGRQVEQKLLRKILKVVCDKQASYASEIAHYVNADKDEVGAILRQLEESSVLEVLKPCKKNNDSRLVKASKRTEKNSLEQMKQPRWYGLNSSVDWELKVNNQNLWVEEYHNKIEDPKGVEKNLLDYAVNRMDESGVM